MLINIMYFASLRDEAKISGESLEVENITVDGLYEILMDKYNFKIQKDLLRVAINEEYKDFNTDLQPNDTVVFIPPVAGG